MKTTPATSATTTTAVNALRIVRLLLSAKVCPPLRNSHHDQHRRQREDCHDGRNDETAVRLRLLQPQIVPRGHGHPGPGLPRAAVPRLERDGPEPRGRERRARRAVRYERARRRQPG